MIILSSPLPYSLRRILTKSRVHPDRFLNCSPSLPSTHSVKHPLAFEIAECAPILLRKQRFYTIAAKTALTFDL